MIFHWILRTRFHRSKAYKWTWKRVLVIILLNDAQANNQHYLFNRKRHAPQGVIDQVKGCMNYMANKMMRHQLGYNCYLFTGFEDHLKTMNVLDIWNSGIVE